MSTNVVVIILNFNNWKDTIQCLEAVWGGSFPPKFVILIDNGSQDGSFEKLCENLTAICPILELKEENAFRDALPVSHGTTILLKSSTNLGFTGGNNLGIRLALQKFDFDYIWLLNSDCVPDKKALEELLILAMSDPKIGVVGSKLLFFSKKQIIQAAGGALLFPKKGLAKLVGYGETDHGQWDKPIKLDYISGASMLIKKEALLKAGLFLEDYFLYWEDADLSIQIQRAGYQLAYAWKSMVFHKQESIFQPKLISDYYISRNTPLFLKRNFPKWLLWGSFYSCIGRFLNRAFKGLWKNAFVVLKAYRDGFGISISKKGRIGPTKF